MRAYELLAHLKNLTLTATDGTMEWIGTKREWDNTENEVMGENMNRAEFANEVKQLTIHND